MASNKRTIYLGLDYSQFSGGITEINRKMGLLDAEFKLATEQAKNYGDKTEQAGIKIDYLSQKIELQNKKVEEAKKAYDAALASNTASQKEIDALDKKLLSERLALEKLNGQLEETKKDTDKVSGSTRSLGEVMGAVKEAVGSLVNQMKDLTTSYAAAGDELLTLSAQTGLSTTELQEMQYAAKFLDVSVETMTGSLTKLERIMNNARNGTGQASEAFKKLHIRITDGRGQLRDANQIFDEAIDKLGKVGNETERDALAMEIFGRSAKDLNPLIKAGGDELERLKQEAHEMGVVMSEESVQAAGRLQDAMDRLNSVFDAAKNELAAAFAPILEKVVDLLSKMNPAALAVIGVIAALAAVFVKIATALKLVTLATAAQTATQGAFNTISTKTVMIVLAIAAALAVVVALIGLITGKKDEVESTVNKATKAATAQTENITNTMNGKTTNKVGRNASGTDNFEGGRTWVGENGPELVTLPRGTKIQPGNEVNGGTVNNYYYATIDAHNVRDFTQVVEAFQSMQMATRRI